MPPPQPGHKMGFAGALITTSVSYSRFIFTCTTLRDFRKLFFCLVIYLILSCKDAKHLNFLFYSGIFPRTFYGLQLFQLCGNKQHEIVHHGKCIHDSCDNYPHTGDVDDF